MASVSLNENDAEFSVFGLISELCNRTAAKVSIQNRIPQNKLSSKMRSYSYEVILKKTSRDTKNSIFKGEPNVDLLSYYLMAQHNAKSLVDLKRCVNLKNMINKFKYADFGDNQDHIDNVLRFLISLSDTVHEDMSGEMYKRPFSFGVLNEMLPKPPRQPFGSPEPYSYYPAHVFELPYSLRNQGPKLENHKSHTYTEYTVEGYDSRSFFQDTRSQMRNSGEVKQFLSPMSLASMTSTHMSPYSENLLLNYPRLTSPRDIRIPTSMATEPNVKISLASTDTKSDIKQMFIAESVEECVDIWEIATNVDKDIPDDIWDVVSKLPPIIERQLIATSTREVGLWRRKYEDIISDLNVISEKQFIRHIMYLIIGIETSSFPFDEGRNCFYMKENLILEGVSMEQLRHYVKDLLLVGTYYKKLYKFAFNQTLDDHFHSNGLVFEASREVIRRYLLDFRLTATEIYEDCCQSGKEDVNCMPTLLQILFHMEPLKYEIETIVSIYKLIDSESKSTLPYGAELMSYLFNEISLVTHKRTAFTMFSSLFSVSKVYFKFIERFIFEGELDDRYHEFFIRKDTQYSSCRSKRYWDKGFHITQSVAVPDFLRSLAKFILLCGKSLRLLKLCNPNDPLVLLISSDHPSVKCCASFDELEHQQQLLDVYRTRCLFVSGEPVTFDQILLKREAERKAFTEMASLKQAETMEKIVAERKRLAQLIIAEKQHSFRVLEAAKAEAKAAKTKVKQREKKRFELEQAAEKATEEVDAKLRDKEKNKIMEYYSKLNMEVEKSKLHTEWKIKRLQLDQSRIQLLSTEERNLKREKLELEHQRNEENMAMSIQSDTRSIDELDVKDEDSLSEVVDNTITDSASSAVVVETGESSSISEYDLNKINSQTSNAVLSAICNAAKNIFRVKSNNDQICDDQKLDTQGNIIGTENNDNAKNTQSSSEIGSKLDVVFDNIQFLKIRKEALSNRQKVMAHEFGQTDEENNHMRGRPLNIAVVDEQNNLQEVWSTYDEAKRNKLKVLGDDFSNVTVETKKVVEPRTDAQREAIINKQKVLGVEYNLPAEILVMKEPANFAQEEAVRNKSKCLGSEAVQTIPKRDNAKRSGLTLNLKPYSEPTENIHNLGITPNTGAITPAEFFPRLDLETPTTADVPPEGTMTNDIFTPRSEGSKDLETVKTKNDKEFITSEGFNFSLMVDEETVDSEVISNIQTGDTPDQSPLKCLNNPEIKRLKTKFSQFNISDGSYNLDDFDPFGIKEFKKYSKDHFNVKMDLDMSSSCYTHPSIIMEEVKKKPYANIFASHFDPEEDHKITCDNIATLTACLQRSVMLPLTYQLEVVNNSILTYFLVNLDMYEHLKSMKDYFFLMDGEFSRSICNNLFSKLVKTLNPQELLNFATLHNILDKALGSSISHVHKCSENLSFTISESPLSFQHSSPDVLQCLSLTYSVAWPLNIILSQEALLRYAKVFQFLIKMRRIFWVLSEDFESLKLSVKLSKYNSRKLLRSPHYISIQMHRHVMAALIRALDNYIVTTCILTSWTEFENDLKKARTLDDLYDCHVAYIKKVLFRCLLNNRSTPVMKLLNDIFTVILKFSRVLKAGEWQQKDSNCGFVHSNFAQLEELFHLFEKLAKYLHKVVTKLTECGYQRHLVELFTMVNLNGYYDPEKSKEDQNTSIQSP